MGHGAFHSCEAAYERFSRTKGFLQTFEGFFVVNKRIFAKFVQDALGVKCPAEEYLNERSYFFTGSQNVVLKSVHKESVLLLLL